MHKILYDIASFCLQLPQNLPDYHQLLAGTPFDSVVRVASWFRVILVARRVDCLKKKSSGRRFI